mmetsp:Transcript_7648/g.11489  ORF Transcript_7648/g.11489 Transcript_7648/m.11489 type:complete len:324 (-) Transcript_7648:13-984(-)
MEEAFELFSESEEEDNDVDKIEKNKKSCVSRKTLKSSNSVDQVVMVNLSLNEKYAGSASCSNIEFSEVTVEKCARSLRRNGIVILKELFAKDCVSQWTEAVIKDLNCALKAVPTDQDHSNLKYHELASRQKLRYEIRNGKEMNAKEGKEILLAHDGVMRIIREAFACNGNEPVNIKEIRKDKDFGAFVSLPGAREQKLHADLDPLFFGGPHLPAHYLTMFLPMLDKESGAYDSAVGQTEFFPGTHVLAAAEKVLNGECAKSIKPQLSSGDAIIYDARLLHRGLANTSKSTVRPLLYVNFQRSWFVDNQNWNENSLFDDQNTKG